MPNVPSLSRINYGCFRQSNVNIFWQGVWLSMHSLMEMHPDCNLRVWRNCFQFKLTLSQTSRVRGQMPNISGLTRFCSLFHMFLAHLSRRLIGELIVYQWLRRPSVHPSVVPQHFQTSSPLKLLGQLNSYFIWRLHRMGERKFVQMVLVTWPRWPPCPYMVKTLKKSSSPEPEGRWTWDLVCSTGVVGPTKFVQMMILGWPWTT